jgi:hypothetical protein
MQRQQYTEADVTWAKSEIQKLKNDGNFKWNGIVKSKVADRYQHRFNRRITESGLLAWFTRIDDPMKHKAYDKAYRERRAAGLPTSARSKNPMSVFQKSSYIILVAGQLMGFETEAEVKDFIANSQILGGVRLFVNQPINIKYNVEIGVK